MMLDMVLALTVLLLLVAVVWPMLGGGTTPALQSALALDIATVLRTDRASAASNGAPATTLIDLRRRAIVAASRRRVEVPSDIAIDVTTGAACKRAARQFAIVFAPDGSSCGGIITLSKGAMAYSIRINWFSGMIDVVGWPGT